MKSKLVILPLILAGFAFTAGAQTTTTEKEQFRSESWKHNFFISGGFGMQAVTNPDNFDNGFGKAIVPHFTLSVGKLFTPIWGVRGQFSGWKNKLNTDRNNSAKIEQTYDKTVFGLHADALVNLSNWWGGYRPERLFSVSFFAGPGFTIAKAFGPAHEVEGERNGQDITERIVKQDDINFLINGSIGFLGQFRITDYWSADIELRGEVSPSPFGKYSNAHTDGALSLTAGLTYTFKGKQFVPANSSKINALESSVMEYKKAAEAAEVKAATTQRELAQMQASPVVKEVEKLIEVAAPRGVFFEIGKANLSDYAKVNLDMAAEAIKKYPDVRYRIAAYADKATGSKALNQRLTEKRAKAVFDYLVSRGVNKDQLEMAPKGGQANMFFNKNKLNRVAIIEIIK